jgi:hypothetical protein
LLPRNSRALRVALLAMLFASMLPLKSTVGHAQEERPADTVGVAGFPVLDSLASRHRDTPAASYHPQKSPATAMLLSAILPGAGQFYNESYWKVPVVLGFGIYFISNWLDNNRRYIDFRDKYRASLLADPGGSSEFLNNREFYKDQRDSFTWYFLIVYFIGIADAYVDASLYDFNVGGDLSLRRLPLLAPETPRAIHFTLRIGF